MGSAYAEGMIDYLKEQGLNVKTVVHLSACDAGDIEVKDKNITRYQLGIDQDFTLFGKAGADKQSYGKDRMIPGVTRYGELHAHKDLFWKKSGESHRNNNYHAATKTYNVWGALNELRDTKIPNGTKRYSGDGNKYNYIFKFSDLKFQWNYFGFQNKYFMKSTDKPSEYRSVDLDSRTDKPCGVGDWF